MILEILGHNFHYEMENLCRVFFPYEKIKTKYIENENENEEIDEKKVTTILKTIDNKIELTVKVKLENIYKTIVRVIPSEHVELTNDYERQMAVCLFEAMTQLTGYMPSWGVLTGVRPSKLMSNLIKQCGEQRAKSYFTEKLLVSAEKTNLAITVARIEERIINNARRDYFSLYVSIPFCPSRCSYCSFVSHSITGTNAKKLLPGYVDNLCKEIKVTGETVNKLGLKLQSVYFGGGTPTTLNESDLSRICETVKDNFDLSHVDEYTVEAGRPDTITPEKLFVLKKNDVSRISINPQSFNDSVLKAVGRNHSAQCVLDAYKLARLLKFESINMDLIAGLPEDTLESFIKTLDTTLDLEPENITLHTLALKRSSSLVTQGNYIFEGEIASKMLLSAQEKLLSRGYQPYYMYRQSRSLGNLENVGWCKPGFEGIYNVFMMEECQTVLSVGAGAVTKLKQSEGSHIERIFNFKYPYEYNSRFAEIVSRKSGILEFYQRFG